MQFFKDFANVIATAVEIAAALIITFGAIEAFVAILRTFFPARDGPRKNTAGARKGVWLRFGVWLLLGLEFDLAADIVRTVIAPSWTDIGQLAAIAVIRTFLNFFLEKDLEKYASEPTVRAAVPAIDINSQS